MRPSGVIITFVDVTGVTEAEAHQRVLIAELNHRVKNMLAVAVGVARARPPKGRVIRARIHRLADLAAGEHGPSLRAAVTGRSWSEADVADLARQELAPFDKDRVRIEGPDRNACSRRPPCRWG